MNEKVSNTDLLKLAVRMRKAQIMAQKTRNALWRRKAFEYEKEFDEALELKENPKQFVDTNQLSIFDK